MEGRPVAPGRTDVALDEMAMVSSCCIARHTDNIDIELYHGGVLSEIAIIITIKLWNFQTTCT